MLATPLREGWGNAHPFPRETRMKVTVMYGTDNGNTRSIAEQIAERSNAKIVEISTATRADFEDCDLLILGTPTCGYGDLQYDWDSRLSMLSEIDFTDRKVALFGLGDQNSYADTFVDAMGILYETLAERNVDIVGYTSTEDYTFDSSRAVRDDRFVGLALDEDAEPHKTEERIESWIASLKLNTAQLESQAA